MTLVRAVDTIYRLLSMAILIRVLVSLIRPQGSSVFYRRFMRIIYIVTEPLLEPVRNLLPTSSMGIDFSPIIVMILLRIMRNILWGVMF